MARKTAVTLAKSASDVTKVSATGRAAAELKANKLRNKMADLDFVVEERDGKCVVVVHSDRVGTERSSQLVKANVIVEPAKVESTPLKEKSMETTTTADTSAQDKAVAAAAEAAAKASAKAAADAAKIEKKAADKRERERAAAEKKEAKDAEKATKAAEREAAKAEKDAAKATKEPTVPGTWREGFDKSAVKKQAMLAEGKPIFRAGSKRETLFKLLEAGTTLADAMAAMAWDKGTTSASFYEIAQLVGRKLNKAVHPDGTAVYSLG